MPLDAFLLFLAAWTLVALSPGPAVMFVMSKTARHGLRGGVAGTLGVVSGHLFTFSAVALGLAALLAKFSDAVYAIRIVGALYLLYLGVKMLLSKPRAVTPINGSAGAPVARHGIMLQGLGVQLTNPKNLLFVLALLPQFIRPGYPLLLQLGIMLTVTIVIDGAVLLAYANLAAHGARALKGSRVVSWLERVFGTALVFFGLKLLTSRR
ncbi:MAG TPA: LysE family translocator [Steroidobacteraceae bacterium]|jgi:homoserine/homoserine lactone efflux protein|nr:LysE family translocator [Steroidobacteraceae bacterium]